MNQTKNDSPEEEEEQVIQSKHGLMGIKFTLKDLITIFTFLATIVTAYTNVSERIIRVEQQVISYSEYVVSMKDQIKELKSDLEAYKKEDARKVNEIEQTLFYIQQQLHRPQK